MECHGKQSSAASAKANNSAGTQRITTEHETTCMPIFACPCQAQVTNRKAECSHCFFFAKLIYKDVGKKLHSQEQTLCFVSSFLLRTALAWCQSGRSMCTHITNIHVQVAKFVVLFPNLNSAMTKKLSQQPWEVYFKHATMYHCKRA